MKKTILMVALAIVASVAFAQTAEAAYDDSACRGANASWTNDACAARQWGP